MLREIGPGENGFSNGGWDTPEADFPNWLRSVIDMAEGVDLAPILSPDHVLVKGVVIRWG